MGRCRKRSRRGACLCPGGCCDCCARDPCEPEPVDPCTPAGRWPDWLWPGPSGGGGGGCDDTDSCDSELQAGRLSCALSEFKRCVLGTMPARVVLCVAGARAILWFFDIDVFLVQI